jgi:ATP-dependent helicase HrpB
MLSTTREVTMQGGKVLAHITTRFADLPIREQIDHHANPQDIAQALADEVRHQARAIFDSDKKAAQVLQRLAFLRQHVPEKPWPTCTDEELSQLLARSCAGKRTIQQVKEQDLTELLLSELDWRLRRDLDELAPETITVPTGNRIRLEYSSGKQPALAVRLQEVFGWLATPRIAAGRVPLVMELLGPNFRPVQITSDLASFWKSAYFEVRKDLRVRYPKHAWPEDPLSAKPEAKGRPRRT